MADIVNGGEIFQIAAQLVVVTLQGFGLLCQICVQLLLLGESHAINTLQHFAFGVTTPVSAGSAGQLNSVALDAAGGVQMGAGAQIGEIALLVEADDCVFRQIVDELNLIGLVLFFHEFDSFSAGQLKALQFQLFLADFTHFCFQSSQIVGSEGSRSIEIIVEAVVDAGADGQLYIGMQSFHSLRQHVGAGVPIGFAVFFVFKGKLFFFRHCLFLL